MRKAQPLRIEAAAGLGQNCAMSDTAASPPVTVHATAPAAEADPPPRTALHLPGPDAALLHVPVNVRNASLAVLATLATVYTLHWASALFVPLMLGVVLSYALEPAVRQLERLRVPRALAAALLLASALGVIGVTGYVLRDDATQFVEGLPESAQKVGQAIRKAQRGPDSALDKVQKAASQLEQAAAEAASPSSRGVTRVQIARPSFDLKDYLLAQLPTIGSGIAQAVVVVFITFFLLAAGSTFRRKLVKLAGPTLAKKKITVQALDEISDQIQRYLMVQVWISVLVGLCTGIAYWMLGVEHAAIWGVLALLMNFVPYIGSLVVTAGSAAAGFLQFGSVDMAMLMAAISLGLHTVSGYLLMPWLTSRASQMNAVAVFIGVLAFGWIWGVWGLVLGMPILLMVKTVCDRSDNLAPVGELLSV